METSYPFPRGRSPRRPQVCRALLCAIALAAPAAAQEAAPPPAPTGFSNSSIAWQLANVRVTSTGTPVQITEGTFTRQYTLEADARSAAPGVASEALFKLAFDVFSPAQAMGSQTPGHWYVQGRWTLEPRVLADAATNPGALTGNLQGRVQATLPFDPTTTPSAWRGSVRVPMTRVRADGVQPGIRPVRGDGELVFTADRAGSLSLDVRLGPKL